MEITNITASYSRKLNHALFGGGQYESSDHFCSLTADLEVGEDVAKAEQELRLACMEQVEKAVQEEIFSFQSGIAPDVFYTYIRDLVANRPIDAETYEACNKGQKAVLQAIKRGKQMHKRDTTKKDEVHHSLQNKNK